MGFLDTASPCQSHAAIVPKLIKSIVDGELISSNVTFTLTLSKLERMDKLMDVFNMKF